MSGTRTSQHPRNGGGKGQPSTSGPRVPHERFIPIVTRLNQLGHYYHRVWPDGVSPKSLFERHVDPVIRWYNSGDRSVSVFKKMQGILKLLDIPSLPPTEDMP